MMIPSSPRLPNQWQAETSPINRGFAARALFESRSLTETYTESFDANRALTTVPPSNSEEKKERFSLGQLISLIAYVVMNILQKIPLHVIPGSRSLIVRLDNMTKRPRRHFQHWLDTPRRKRELRKQCIQQFRAKAIFRQRSEAWEFCQSINVLIKDLQKQNISDQEKVNRHQNLMDLAHDTVKTMSENLSSELESIDLCYKNANYSEKEWYEELEFSPFA